MGMRLEVDLAPAAIRDVRVALRRSEVGVPEHLLHAAEVGAALEQVRGERVAKEMGVDALRLEPRLSGQLSQDEERPCAGERAAAGVEEELGAVAAIEVGSTEGEVPSNRFRGRPPEWNEALLSALPEDADDSLLDVDGAPVQPDRLRDPQSGAVEKLDQRPVAPRARRRPDRRLDEALRLGRGERPRQAASPARPASGGR